MYRNQNVRRTDQTMLFAMVQPVASAACPNNPLQLVSLHPNQFIDALISTHINIAVFIISIAKLVL